MNDEDKKQWLAEGPTQWERERAEFEKARDEFAEERINTRMRGREVGRAYCRILAREMADWARNYERNWFFKQGHNLLAMKEARDAAIARAERLASHYELTVKELVSTRDRAERAEAEVERLNQAIRKNYEEHPLKAEWEKAHAEALAAQVECPCCGEHFNFADAANAHNVSQHNRIALLSKRIEELRAGLKCCADLGDDRVRTHAFNELAADDELVKQNGGGE